MSVIQDKMQAMIRDYELRIKKTNRQKLLMLSISIPLLVIIGAYLSFSYAQFKKITDPSNLVDIGYDLSGGAISDAASKIESYLIESAPGIVNSGFALLMDQMPIARKATQERLDLLLDEALRATEEYFSVALQGIVATYREDILSVAQVDDKEQTYILAARVEDDLRSRFNVETDEAINKFATVLREVDKQLDTLVRVHPAHLTQEEALERRFLDLWAQIMDERLPAPE